MYSKILQSLANLTKERDIDSLECSLIASLSELLPSQHISLNKIIPDSNKGTVNEVISLSTIEMADHKKHVEWQPLEKTVDISDSLLESLANEKIYIENPTPGKYSIFLSLFNDENLSGFIHIVSDKISSDDIKLLSAFIHIYQNYHLILNESERDKLTGLYNRRTFDQKLSRLLVSQRCNAGNYNIDNNQRRKLLDDTSAWLVLIDIDHFKQVNDKFGHIIGDEVILILAQLMSKCFRQSDLLFRFGGEEFLIVLEPISYENAMNTLERFRTTVAAHQFPQVENITVSIGYSAINEQDFPVKIIEQSDKALYYAKQNGRNRIFNYEYLVQQGYIEPSTNMGSIDIF